jgi:hypothetical protein
MIVSLKFGGWFQCRLATDPDPADEPRGVSGYVRAVAGEPDLDRVIYFQSPPAPRSHCPNVGVRVLSVHGDSRYSEEHPLVGATVDLLDAPKFEGRNGIIAEDGFEPIVPLHIRVAQGQFSIQRRFRDVIRFPPVSEDDWVLLKEVQATDVNFSPGVISELTGIDDLWAVWRQRISLLQEDAKTADDVARTAIAARIASMSDRRNARFFPARMLYAIGLTGSATVADPEGRLPGTPIRDDVSPWMLEMWFGGWDPDALSGYVEGFLQIPCEDATSVKSLRVDAAAARLSPTLAGRLSESTS